MIEYLTRGLKMDTKIAAPFCCDQQHKSSYINEDATCGMLASALPEAGVQTLEIRPGHSLGTSWSKCAHLSKLCFPGMGQRQPTRQDHCGAAVTKLPLVIRCAAKERELGSLGSSVWTLGLGFVFSWITVPTHHSFLCFVCNQ